MRKKLVKKPKKLKRPNKSKKPQKPEKPKRPRLHLPQLKPIKDIARAIGIREKYIEPYGQYKAKVSLDIFNALKSKKKGKYILVTSITPTPLGEGKTVTAIGLSMALNRMKKRAVACLPQPSVGAIFGVKGPGTGGGLSQIFPREEANLYLTGDSCAVQAAQNLCAAYLDNSVFHGNPLGIDPGTVVCKRAINANDRFLRTITIGLGSKSDGITRKTGFEQTAASEPMAILALTDGIKDMRKRIGRIIIGFTPKGKPVTCEDIKAAGSMAVLLKDAIKPNLLQTSEATPCFVHTGSTADAGLGTSSIISDEIALRLCDYVVTETGFGSDIGAEKFFNIKCRISGNKPDLAVIVCSLRALKMHSDDFSVTPGKQLPRELYRENVSAVERGFSNLEKQIENLQTFGVPVVVCINRFKEDTEKEIAAAKRRALLLGVKSVAVSDAYYLGGEGSMELARQAIEACKVKHSFRFLYPNDIPIKEKIRRIAKAIYGAGEVVFSEIASKKAIQFKKLKLDQVPVVIDKAHLSLSHNPKKKGRPHGFKFPVDDLQLQNGAGFISALTQNSAKRPPGLPKIPRGVKIDLDEEGKIKGLF